MSDEQFRAGAPVRRRFGPYDVVERLADTRLGPAHRAVDPATGESVVVQVLSPAVRDVPGQRERLAAEAVLLTGWEHPNLVPVLACSDERGPSGEPGTVWIARPAVEGTSLATALAAGTRLEEDQALGLVHDVLTGLVRLHHRGLLHRDLCPDSILVTPSGASMLTDIGATVPRVDELGVPHTGDPAYLSPEAAAGLPLTPASDVYAVGALAFHLLSGAPPFTGTTVEVLQHHQHTPAPALDGHGEALAELVGRCLAKDPADRPTDAAALLAELELALEPAAAPAEAPPATAAVGARRAETRSRWRRGGVVAAGVLAGALLVGGIGYGLTRDGDPADGPEPEPTSPSSTTEPGAPETTDPSDDPVVASVPNGVWVVRSKVVESTNRAYGRKGRPAAPQRRWTFTAECRDVATCGGRIASDSGTDFVFTWDGKALRITRVPSRFEGDVPCVDNETGERVPQSQVRLVQTYRYAPFEPRGEADPETGMPTRFVGKATERWRYSRFRGGCSIEGIARTGARSPKVTTRFEVVRRTARDG